MKIWIDDIRTAPEGHIWCHSVNEAVDCLYELVRNNSPIDIIAIDHDAGDYYKDGGDFYKVLDWLEEHNTRDLNFKLLTQNGVGRDKLKAIIEHNAERLNWSILQG